MLTALAFAVALAAPPPDMYAIVIGYNGAAAGLPTLHYADDDAIGFARFFGALAGEDHVVLLTTPDAQTQETFARAKLVIPSVESPTRRSLFAAFDSLRVKLAQRPPGRAALLYFVYAGHGLSGRFLLQPEGATEAAFTGHELRAALGTLPIERAAVFIDACRAQSLFVERGADSGPDLAAEVDELERRASAVSIGVLTAATSNQPAGEAADLQAGTFSHVLASGLAGAADANGDDVVTFGELAAFVAFNTQRLTGQRPWFDPPGGDLNATAIDHRNRRGRLVFGEQAGHYRVESREGRPVFAEANKGEGQSLKLLLPPGHYRVVHLLDADHGRAGDVSLGETDTAIDDRALTLDVELAELDGQRGAEVPDSARAGFAAPFTSEIVATLAAGFQSGREPSFMHPRSLFGLRLGYGVALAPLGLVGLDQAVELDVRRRETRFSYGVHADYRTSFPNGKGYELRRPGLFLLGEFDSIPHLGIAIAAGVRSTFLFRKGSPIHGDAAAPALRGLLSMPFALAADFSLYAEAGYENVWMKVDGVRQPFGQFFGSIGVNYGR